MMGGFDVGWFHPGKNEQIKKQKRDVKSLGKISIFVFLDVYIFVVTNMCGEDFSNLAKFLILRWIARNHSTANEVLTNLAAPFWGIIADRGLLQRRSILTLGCLGDAWSKVRCQEFWRHFFSYTFDELRYLMYLYRYDIHWYSYISKNGSICWCIIWYCWIRVIVFDLAYPRTQVARPEAERDFRHHD